jgi:hypothetical protein
MVAELESLARLVGVDQVAIDANARGDLTPELRHHVGAQIPS